MPQPSRGLRLDGHPEALRRKLTAEDPGSPLVTYYAPATGARVELSRATFDNWVAKAAGMLAEEADVEAGSHVVVDLQPHWLLPVWCWAAWSLGAAVSLPGVEVSVDPAVVITDAANRPAGELVLSSSRHPLGLQLGPQTPTGMIDALADIRGFPDVRSDPLPAADAALVTDVTGTTHGGEELAAALATMPQQCRAALLRSSPGDRQALVRALIGPLLGGGALVLIDGGGDADVDRIRQQERIDIDLD